jgi:hypothetical protein
MEREVVSRGRLAIESRRNLRPTVWITYFFDGSRLIHALLIKKIQIPSARRPENSPEGFESKICRQESLVPQS